MHQNTSNRYDLSQLCNCYKMKHLLSTLPRIYTEKFDLIDGGTPFSAMHS